MKPARSSPFVDVDADVHGAAVRAVHTALRVLPAAQRKIELQACHTHPCWRAAARPDARHRGGARR